MMRWYVCVCTQYQSFWTQVRIIFPTFWNNTRETFIFILRQEGQLFRNSSVLSSENLSSRDIYLDLSVSEITSLRHVRLEPLWKSRLLQYYYYHTNQFSQWTNVLNCWVRINSQNKFKINPNIHWLSNKNSDARCIFIVVLVQDESFQFVEFTSKLWSWLLLYSKKQKEKLHASYVKVVHYVSLNNVSLITVSALKHAVPIDSLLVNSSDAVS